MAAAYIDAVFAVGGVPVLLPPPPLGDDVMSDYDWSVFDRADAVMCTGGYDLSCARLGVDEHPSVTPLHPRREQFELACMRRAIRQRMPVLGICLGMQILAHLYGATICVHLDDESRAMGVDHGREHHTTTHPVSVVAGTLLADITGQSVLTVPSRHHQAVTKVADDVVRVSAVSPDGIIEAVELPDHPFALGVQWHVEEDISSPVSRAIFDRFVAAARSR